jgi:hypothetical protein
VLCRHRWHESRPLTIVFFFKISSDRHCHFRFQSLFSSFMPCFTRFMPCFTRFTRCPCFAVLCTRAHYTIPLFHLSNACLFFPLCSLAILFKPHFYLLILFSRRTPIFAYSCSHNLAYSNVFFARGLGILCCFIHGDSFISPDCPKYQ